MDEYEWLTSTNPAAMLALRIAGPRIYWRGLSKRKMRQFVCAWWRSITPHSHTQECVTVAIEEHGYYHTKGMTINCTVLELLQNCYIARPNQSCVYATGANFLREVAGNPFHSVSLCGNPDHGSVVVRPFCAACQRFRTPTVVGLAQAAYDERLPDGTLDPIRLALLADELEEVGCENVKIINHLRGKDVCPECSVQKSGYREDWIPLRGPHVRGCWALDLILGKE